MLGFGLEEIFMENVTPGIYKHFKGNLYFVAGVAQHTEDENTKLVVYYPLYPNETKMFARPLDMWNEKVEREGYSGPRFEKLLSWSLSNCLPGRRVARKQQVMSDCVIVQLRLAAEDRVVVEYRSDGSDPEAEPAVMSFMDFIRFYEM